MSIVSTLNPVVVVPETEIECIVVVEKPDGVLVVFLCIDL